ncbi:MAG TPA: hypothetical protein VK401_13675 [Propionibacteriaceae bacterium]|jgi:hypothetical protein|nr:hypothetical protein [Propionibacteriaceae bacterium]
MLPPPFLSLGRPRIPVQDTELWRQLARRVEQGRGEVLPYDLAMPKWRFLSLLVEEAGVLLHGSSDPDIEEFRPRQPVDVDEFSRQHAVYAASDGVWPIYFAIVDRTRVGSLLNACFTLPDGNCGDERSRYYFFSIEQTALGSHPWRAGTIYVLPRRSFVPQPPVRIGGHVVRVQQWASAEAVRPLARLPVVPADFPLLESVVPHHPALVRERSARDPDGFPWLDEPE